MRKETKAKNHEKQILHNQGQQVTHAYVHWLADVHSGSFAPAFTLSFHDSECSRKPPNAHSLGRYLQAKKKEDRNSTDKVGIRQNIKPTQQEY